MRGHVEDIVFVNGIHKPIGNNTSLKTTLYYFVLLPKIEKCLPNTKNEGEIPVI